MQYEQFNTLDRLHELNNRARTGAREDVRSQQELLARNREAANQKVLSQGPGASFDLPDAAQFGNQNAQQAAPQRQSAPTGGGAGYVGRPQGQVTDRSIEISEGSKRLQAMRNAQAPTQPLSELDRAQLVYKQRSGKMTPADQVAFDNLRKMDARGNPTVPTERMNATQNQISAWQSEDAARARGKVAPSSTGRTGQYDRPNQYDPLIQQAAAANGIDPVMFKRLIGSESSFRPDAASPRGESFGYGIAQIAAVHGLSKEQMANPAVALPFAAKLLKQYIDKSGGDVREGIMRYKGAVSEQGRAAMGAVYDRDIAGGQSPQAQAGQPAQSAQMPQGNQPQATYSGMGPAGEPRMLAEQLQLAQFKYNQLAQLLPNSTPEQQMKLQAEMSAIHSGARAQQAYMLASQANVNPQALAQLVSMSGSQAARTQDGRFVLVDQNGSAASEPMTAGQMGAYLFRAMDSKAQEAQANAQKQIAIETAKQQAIAQGKILEQGGNSAELEQLKSLLRQMEEQAKPGMFKSAPNPMGAAQLYNERTGAYAPPMPQQPNTVRLPS